VVAPLDGVGSLAGLAGGCGFFPGQEVVGAGAHRCDRSRAHTEDGPNAPTGIFLVLFLAFLALGLGFHFDDIRICHVDCSPFLLS